jgi:hypothetical protein
MLEYWTVSHVCCAECRRWINSLLHRNHMVFGPELIKRRHSSLHRSLSIDLPFVEYDRSTCWSTCMSCSRVPTLVQISPPLKSYGVWARIAWSSEMFISSILEYRSAVRWVSNHMIIEYRSTCRLHMMYCAECGLSCKSLLHWNHMVFGQELHEHRNCSYASALAFQALAFYSSV